MCDGELLLARLRADLHRTDLAQAGIGDGCHAFHYTIAESQRDGCEHEIHVCFEGTRIDLANSPLYIVFGRVPHRTHELARMFRNIAPIATWNIDVVDLKDRSLSVDGWALPSSTGQAGTFTVNGEQVQAGDLSYPRWRPDVSEVFWYVPHSSRSGFNCTIDWHARGYSETDTLCIDYVDRESNVPWIEHHTFYLQPRLLSQQSPTPPEKNILRVAGYTSANKFVLDGYTTVVKLQKVLRQTVGLSLADFHSILDWGCGCGRVTRHLIDASTDAAAMVTGIDIDQENIRWCQANLPGASFESCELHPPTQYPEASFDLIIGMSVFSHLDEATQFEWLREMRRVAMPGACLLFTVHGCASVCRSGVDHAWLDNWLSRGIDDTWKDPALCSVIDDNNYYRAVFHTKDYIRQRWAEYFDVVTIVDGFLSNNQDLVLLRSKSL